jgi:hypothetical protein
MWRWLSELEEMLFSNPAVGKMLGKVAAKYLHSYLLIGTCMLAVGWIAIRAVSHAERLFAMLSFLSAAGLFVGLLHGFPQEWASTLIVGCLTIYIGAFIASVVAGERHKRRTSPALDNRTNHQ